MKFLYILIPLLILLFSLLTCSLGPNKMEYYTTHGIMTEPGKHINLYKNLPSEIADICKITQGLMRTKAIGDEKADN